MREVGERGLQESRREKRRESRRAWRTARGQVRQNAARQIQAEKFAPGELNAVFFE